MAEYECAVGKLISMLYRYWQIYLSRELKEYQIGCGQYQFLTELYKHDGICQEELSAYLNVDKATTAKAIKKLMQEGYVVRQTDFNDKRVYKLCVTAKALELKRVMQDIRLNWVNTLFLGLNDEEKKNATLLLERMATNSAWAIKNEEIRWG